ncbi:hypothetical protein [endosymbiont GvMRE of Glomus versiforme]|uniref:hypothetical protein n=1 Tax=endosymbiont GvMRE of Glomus versiforme TaxID=2039283 RepID=UPI0011C4890E|nr:hypothetical protein [endosymbiont GvMRE of Glomus versiforme]
MNKKQCLVCQSLKVKPPVNEWIKENQFQGKHGQILKEVYIGNVKENPKGRKVINTVYYCSWACFNQQLEQEEKKDFAKGFCSTCGEYLVVLNEQCKDEKHKQEAHYYRLKGGQG